MTCSGMVGTRGEEPARWHLFEAQSTAIPGEHFPAFAQTYYCLFYSPYPRSLFLIMLYS